MLNLDKESFKKNLKIYSPIIFLFLFCLIIHSFYNVGIDDRYFSTYVYKLFIFDQSNLLVERYYTWSSRIFIEFFLCILAKVFILWELLDSVIYSIIAFLIPNLLIKNFKGYSPKKKFSFYLISVLLVLLSIYVNFIPFIQPGFITSTLNYTWPFAFALIHFYILKNYILQDKQLKKLTKIGIYFLFIFSFLFAIDMEIMSVVIFLVYLFIIIYLIKLKNIKTHKFLFLFLFLSGLMVLFHLTCPGNYVRFSTETACWLREYYSLSKFNKIDIGLTSILYLMLTRFDFLMITLLFAVIGYYNAILSKKKIIALFSFYPFIVMLIVFIIRFIYGSSFINFCTNVFKPSTSGVFHGLIARGFYLPSMLMLFLFVTIFLSLILSIIFIIRYRGKNQGLIIASLLFIAYVSQCVCGNSSSSILIYPEYPGRYWIIFNNILILPIAYMVYDLIDNRKFFK